MKTNQKSFHPISRKPADTFSWNLVSKGFKPTQAQSGQIRVKIDHLATHLDRFPPQMVHLQIVLSFLEAEDSYGVQLNLKLPSTVLHTDMVYGDAATAIGDAFEKLERQLGEYIAELPGRSRWDQSRSRREVGDAPEFGSPLLRGPQTGGDLLRNFILRHYHRLLLHAHREVAGLEGDGGLPSGVIDPHEVLDEVVRICLEDPGSKPVHLTYELWLYQLIREMLEHERLRILEERGLGDEFPSMAEDHDYEKSDLREALSMMIDPDEALEGEMLSDSASQPPDLLLKQSDLVTEVLVKTRHWPDGDRAIFELYFLEGLDPVEIAMVRKMEPADVMKRIEELHLRLRDLLRAEGG